MKFNNKHNEKVIISLKWWQKIVNFITNKEKYKKRVFWLSRSCSVVASIVVIKDNIPYILINKRGKGTPDFQGYWNLPCGYIDWDENSKEAAIREVWEECGVNLIKLMNENNLSINYMDNVWDVKSSPKGNKQNISLYHGLIVNIGDKELPYTSLENTEPDEVEEVEWIPLAKYDNKDYAFNHKERIEKFIKKTSLNI